ncbi:MAG TPA: DUF3108 domain-containing protein [Gemmatimonadaceae bacterium]|nr:DUF3108 domain-containing protein [Gemmatimonadaceae bacterium]
MRRPGFPASAAMLAVIATGWAAFAQSPVMVSPVRTSTVAALSADAAAVPFGPGEKSTFEVRFGGVKVGGGSLQVVAVENVRGRDAYHTAFVVQGGTFFYRVNDSYESWFDTRTLNSLLFIRQIEEGSRERAQTFEIMPERGTYTERTRQETMVKPTVEEPLDEGAFLYFVRTVPLVVGRTYDFHRYFMPTRNPVRLTVLRKERVKVPAGTFNAIVVRPVIKTRGIFSEKGQAEVWIADDTTRMLLQLKSKLSFGSLNLYLRSYTPAKAQAKATRD